MFQEFKTFISRGNVLEMAVGLIMATYFGAIVKSLVDHIIMPPLGLLLGGVDFKELNIVIREAKAESIAGAGDAIPEIVISYGMFINQIITFILVAFSVFLVIKSYNTLKDRISHKEDVAPEPEQLPEPTKEELLLTEIRDLLKNK
jgi:large conductance mechanosensitive channel